MSKPSVPDRAKRATPDHAAMLARELAEAEHKATQAVQPVPPQHCVPCRDAPMSRETTNQSIVIQGEALAELQKLPDAIATAVITDPPYSSGGAFRGDRMADPSTKYCQNGETVGRISFSGDNRDGRSWAYWCAMWMSEAQQIGRAHV